MGNTTAKDTDQSSFTLRLPSRRVSVRFANGATILEALAGESAVSIAAPCGGRGKCGKCGVRVLSPQPGPDPTAADLRFLSGDELTAGIRLACTCKASLVYEIEAPREYREASVKGELPVFSGPATPSAEVTRRGTLAVAVDIGTTTVAAFLIRSANGEPVDVIARMNRQSVYGADVLSRIAYADTHGEPPLTEAIRVQIDLMLRELVARNGGDTGAIGTVSIAGNTTMLHFLAGEDASGIGRAPFVPAFLEARTCGPEELNLDLHQDARVILLPSVSAYVGADIVAAAVAAELDTRSETTLLVDIGTNGEIALRHNGKVWACSTAAGPAFEGASISAGVGGIPGAITSFAGDDSDFGFETIGGAEPVGVCGSGLLDVLATLLEDGAVDETGRMMRPEEAQKRLGSRYRERIVLGQNGEPAFRMANRYLFTQQDVREVQLAKAAIAAGIDTLLAEAQIRFTELQKVVLTGGFGNHLRVASAVGIGLLPDLEAGRFETMSNGAGIGALMVLRQRDVLDRMGRLHKEIAYVELSGHSFFQDRYIEHMTFPE